MVLKAVTKGISKEVAEGIPKEMVEGVLEWMVVGDVMERVHEGDMAEDKRMLDTTSDVVFMSKGTIEVRKDKKLAANIPELVVDKKSRFSSQYTVSPFMAEAKKRTFVDGTFSNLLCGAYPIK